MPETPGPVLVEPSAKFRDEFLDMANEDHLAGEDRYDSERNDFKAYLDRVEQYSTGRDLPPDRVPSTEFWLMAGRRIFGRGSLRHRLNSSLKNEGGHIGYDIRPSERRKGYGTLILKLMLERAREKGFERVLVTCDEDNVGSAKIIEKNGGILSGKGVSERSGKSVLHYWIDLSGNQ